MRPTPVWPTPSMNLSSRAAVRVPSCTRLRSTATAVRLLRIGFRVSSCFRNAPVAGSSKPEGSTGTTMTSARRNRSSTFFSSMAAGASITRRSMSFGGAPGSSRQSRARIGAALPGRAFSQPRALPWRSASASAVRRPAAAKAAARWVAMVLLPQPPFGLATRTVIMASVFRGLVPEGIGGGEGLPGMAHLGLDVHQGAVVPADHLADGALDLARAAAGRRRLGEVHQQVLGDRHVVQMAEALLQVAQGGEIVPAALGRVEPAEELGGVAQLLHRDA